MHACTQQFINRRHRPQFGSLTRSWGDSCVEDGFFFFFGAWIRCIRPIFSLPQLAFDLTSTPTISDSCRQRSSISLTAVPRNHVEHSFRKARQLWTLSKLPSPCHYFEKRKKTTTTRPKFFSTQSTVSPLHAPSSAGTCCLHVLLELGRGAASFLATESNTPFRRPSCQAREEKRKFSPTATSLRRRRQRSRTWATAQCALAEERKWRPKVHQARRDDRFSSRFLSLLLTAAIVPTRPTPLLLCSPLPLSLSDQVWCIQRCDCVNCT